MDDYKTDKWIADLFRGWHDPCPYQADFNGLKEPWKINTFINPPYSNVRPWVEKAIHDNNMYGATMVLLLKVDTSTKWFAKLNEAGANIMWINRRLKYKTGKAAPFPSMLAVLEGNKKHTKNINSY